MTTNKPRVQVYVEDKERAEILKVIDTFNKIRDIKLSESQFYLMCVRKTIRQIVIEANNNKFLDRQIKANPSTQ